MGTVLQWVMVYAGFCLALYLGTFVVIAVCRAVHRVWDNWPWRRANAKYVAVLDAEAIVHRHWLQLREQAITKRDRTPPDITK